MVTLLRWLADHCHCLPGEALPLAVPERQGMRLETLIHLEADWDGEPPPRVGIYSKEAFRALYETLTKVMSEFDHVGEIKRPQPPWPHGVI